MALSAHHKGGNIRRPITLLPAVGAPDVGRKEVASLTVAAGVPGKFSLASQTV